jgi:hypothetical protein
MNNKKQKKVKFQCDNKDNKIINPNTKKLLNIQSTVNLNSNNYNMENKNQISKMSNNFSYDLRVFIKQTIDEKYIGIVKILGELMDKIQNIQSFLGQKRIRHNDSINHTPKKKYSKFEEKDIDINNEFQNELYSPNVNSDNESIVSDTYNANFNLRKSTNINKDKIKPVEKFLMDYFNKDCSNSIFYGTPKKSRIEITSPNIIKYEKMAPNKKQFIILGKEKIKFNENFKIQFIVNKFDSHFYVGFINLDLALKSNTMCRFHNWKSEASILFSTRKTIWNYLDNTLIKKGGIKIKCNEVKITSSINFSYSLKDKILKIELRDFQKVINLSSIANNKSDYRFIIFFEGPGTIIQIKKN